MTRTVTPRHVPGGPGHSPPSEIMNIAGIGHNHLKARGAANVIALCEVHCRHAVKTFKACLETAAYKYYRVMLEK